MPKISASLQLLWISPDQLQAEQLDRLEACQLAPKQDFDRQSRLEILSDILAGNIKLFTLGPVLLSVSVQESNGQRLLVLENFCSGTKGKNLMPRAVKEMRKLAKHWNCSHVETRVFAENVQKFLLLLGCHVDSAIVRVEA